MLPLYAYPLLFFLPALALSLPLVRPLPPSALVLERVRMEAKQGHHHQQYMWGLYCHYGLGVPVDAAEAASSFRASAEGGYVLGMLALATVLEGEGGLGSEGGGGGGAALSWYVRAGEGGELEGYYRAGTMLFEGRATWQQHQPYLLQTHPGGHARGERGVDLMEAFRLLRKAGDAGYVPALDSLGLMCEYGAHRESGEQDFGAAARFYQQGCEWKGKIGEGGGASSSSTSSTSTALLGGGSDSEWVGGGQSHGTSPDPEACYHLGLMAAYGRGMAQDFPRAITLLQRANGISQKNHRGLHPPSSLLLGKLYANGQGVTPNYAAALAFLGEARDSGDHRVAEEAGRLYAAFEQQVKGAEEGMAKTLKGIEGSLKNRPDL